jgi:hypothetical protein
MEGAHLGYWVWVRTERSGNVERSIAPSDMEIRVGTGAGSWPGCVDGISCTRYGVHRFAFTGDGRAFYGFNVNTSSDWSYPGTYSFADGVLQFTRSARYSCAHPDSDTVGAVGYQADMFVQNDELYVSVASEQAFNAPPLARGTGFFMVFRRIAADAFYGASWRTGSTWNPPIQGYHLVTRCYAERAGVPSCHAACVDPPPRL